MIIQTDMSNEGMGAVLLQDRKPITFASRVWKQAEKGYVPIEKEMFSDYCYGRFVTVESDHKPLAAIHKKPLNAPNRLRNMLLELQKFDFEIIYRPGKEIVIPDCLSRAPLPTENNACDIIEVNLLTELAVSETIY